MSINSQVITEVTRRLVTELNPEEIILFGSYAWGTPNKYSDLDICVIVTDAIPGFDRIEWGVSRFAPSQKSKVKSQGIESFR